MARRPGLTARLLMAQLLVVLAGLATLSVVAFTVGPPLLRGHLRSAVGAVTPHLSRHLEDAFLAAGGISLGIGIAAFLAAAVVAAVLLTRRLSRPIHDLADAADRVTAGDYTARLGPTRLGPEFETLTSAFNTMADALENTERTRRRLLGDVAHELRTPLATIEAYLEGLADGVRTLDAHTLDVLGAQTTRLHRLVEDISLVSRAEEHRLTLVRAVIPAARLADAAADAVRPGFQTKGVDLRVMVTPGTPAVDADRDRLVQVLVNLLTNALRHTPAGGTVTVAAEPARAGVVIRVADTGEGIAAEHLPHIFERFYRADTGRDREHGGSGIGLAVARALVHAHGGTVSASSEGPGRGAVFRISLPAASARPDLQGSNVGP
ncbi:HAMP domain-containing histidine kinase [Streptomyces luteolifulvus]|uniref:histidine kinase n=1 Tax=Streptomyces luteolifulvus TaxID=2615112 RepID=A0A6H9V7H6_9ACTN|nr:ATP-binding protein [Streptomyces luteolifulvus]KAB1149775.1 HAMP domain-containing histidine kinase [Streptomyces luteolifulvus]